MLLLLIILIVTVLAWICYQRAYGRFVELGNRLPGPKTIPILGNAHHFINLPAEDNLKTIGLFFQEFGNTYRVWLGMELDILFRDLKDLEVIMTGMEFSKKADVYDLMKPWLNEGVLLSSGKKWHVRRKFITPAFHFKILDEYSTVFQAQSKLFCKVLETQLHSKSIDLHQFVSRYTLDVILEQLKLLPFLENILCHGRKLNDIAEKLKRSWKHIKPKYACHQKLKPH